MKKCRKCNEEKSLSEFYKHKAMADGRLNICKDCTKKRVNYHREKNIEEIREYDRKRSKLDHRKALNGKTTKVKRQTIKGYMAAHNAVKRAVDNGIIIRPSICSWCGKKHQQIEGHHQDYSKKLSVVWLCSQCHSQLHIGVGKKAEKMREKIKIP